jgi:hypothetical protein
LKYKIVYDYSTGDSAGSETRCNQELDYKWTSLIAAEESLKRLADHYKFVCSYSDYRHFTTTRDVLVEEAKTQPWFTQLDFWKYSVMLLDDNGKPFQLSVPWCGYFESLLRIEVAIEGLKVEF